MPKVGRGSQKLTESKVRDLTPPARGERTIWDGEIKGLGVRIRATGAGGRQPAKTFILKYRTRGGVQRKLTLGDWIPAAGSERGNVDEMRGRAHIAIGRIEQGDDPAGAKQVERQAGTMAELCDRFLVEYALPKKKPSTAAEYSRLVEARIKPELGRLLVVGLTGDDLARFHHSMRDAPRSANQALSILSRMLNLAETPWRLRPKGSNPCRAIERFPEKRRDRYYTEVELKRIGRALDELKNERAIFPGEAAAITLLALTGCRLSEVLNLRWDDVDFRAGELRLADSKVGRRVHTIGRTAIRYLQKLFKARESELVVEGAVPGEPISVNDLEVAWGKVRKRAAITDARMHDLRHSLATLASNDGANAFVVQHKLGHKHIDVTAGYVTRTNGPVRELSDKVEAQISAAMGGKMRARPRRGGTAT